MIATINNMREAVAKHGKECRLVMVDSEGTEFSANPNDYWNISSEDDVMTDLWNNPMHLMIKRTIWEEA